MLYGELKQFDVSSKNKRITPGRMPRRDLRCGMPRVWGILRCGRPKAWAVFVFDFVLWFLIFVCFLCRFNVVKHKYAKRNEYKRDKKVYDMNLAFVGEHKLCKDNAEDGGCKGEYRNL